MNVQLNFTPLLNQNIDYQIFTSPHTERADKRLLCFTLPIPNSNTPNNRATYDISFEYEDGFEPRSIHPSDNNRLFIKYLQHQLESCVRSTLNPNDYDILSDGFNRGVYINLQNHPEGIERIWIEPIYLNVFHKFGFLLDYSFRKNDSYPFNKKVQILSLSIDRSGNSNKDFYIDKYNKLRYFFEKYHDSIFSNPKYHNLSITRNKLFPVNYNILEQKIYIFGLKKTHSIPFSGIDRYGPLECVDINIKFALIYDLKNKLLVHELAKALTGRSSDIQFRGLKEVFRLNLTGSLDLSSIFNGENSIKQIADTVLSEQRVNPDVKYLPLAIITKEDESLYNSIKYEFLKNGFPVQVVSTEKIIDKSTFKWAIADIGLQIFAKLGGQPWSIAPGPEKSLVFGIGQAHEKDESGATTRYFSYIVCTDSTGIYKYSDFLGVSTNENKYLSQLKARIIQVISNELSAERLNCVLHIPYKIKKSEIESINSAIVEIINMHGKDIRFTVIKINDESKFFGYSDTNSLVPLEGAFCKIKAAPSTYLVWLEGLQQNNTVLRKRPSGPILIEFFWSNFSLTENDEISFLQEISNLSGCNWTGFKSKHIPISIFYCQLIAKRIKKFGNRQIDTQIKEPWFL